MAERILVAGIGNIFCSDDGFGCAVAEELTRRKLPPGVEVIDYGIRGMHLALDVETRDDGAGIDALILVDTVPAAGGGPGSVAIVEVDRTQFCDPVGAPPSPVIDAHGMDPSTMLASLIATAGRLPPTTVVGCQPATIDEGMGLSTVVAAAVPVAADTVLDLVERLRNPDPSLEHTRTTLGGTA